MKQRSALAGLWMVNAALALALLAWWLWPRAAQWQPPAPIAPDYASALQDAALPGHLNASDYTEVVKAPLFETSRQWPDAPPPPAPPEAPKTPQPAPKDVLDEARVLGVYDQGSEGAVILEIEGKARRLRLGESVEGWTLRAIDGLSVRLTHPQQPDRILDLKRRHDNPPVVPANEAQQRRRPPQPR